MPPVRLILMQKLLKKNAKIEDKIQNIKVNGYMLFSNILYEIAINNESQKPI